MTSFARFHYLIFALSVIGALTDKYHAVEAFTCTGIVRSIPTSSCPPSASKQAAKSPSLSSRRYTIPRSHRVKSANTATQLSNKNDDEEYDPREKFGRELRGFQSSALKTQIDVGDTVVCKRSIPNLGIYGDSSYEVTSIYTQYFDEETQQIVKLQMSSLDNESDTGASATQTYMTLFSPQFHPVEGSTPGGAVIVTPEEVGLASVREELGNALWLAVPGLFWVILVASFYNTYHMRTGGSFADALMGR